jgi:hypothetical protein
LELWVGGDFLNMTPTAQAIKDKIDELIKFIKIKSLYASNNTIK